MEDLDSKRCLIVTGNENGEKEPSGLEIEVNRRVFVEDMCVLPIKVQSSAANSPVAVQKSESRDRRNRPPRNASTSCSSKGLS